MLPKNSTGALSGLSPWSWPFLPNIIYLAHILSEQEVCDESLSKDFNFYRLLYIFSGRFVINPAKMLTYALTCAFILLLAVYYLVLKQKSLIKTLLKYRDLNVATLVEVVGSEVAAHLPKNKLSSGNVAFPTHITQPPQTGTVLKDIYQVPGPVILPVIGTKWQYYFRYQLPKIHEAYYDLHKRHGDIVLEVGNGHPYLHLFNRNDIDKVGDIRKITRHHLNISSLPLPRSCDAIQSIHSDPLWILCGSTARLGRIVTRVAESCKSELRVQGTHMNYMLKYSSLADREKPGTLYGLTWHLVCPLWRWWTTSCRDWKKWLMSLWTWFDGPGTRMEWSGTSRGS